MDRTELGHWLRLLATPGVGNETARLLLASFGLPEAIFAQPTASLRAVAGPAVAQALAQPPDGLDQLVQETWDWQHDDTHGGVKAVVTLADPRYPPALLAMEDPPPLLYLHGAARWIGAGAAGTSGVDGVDGVDGVGGAPHASEPVTARVAPLGLDRCVAIVGSRNPTPQGAENARQFAFALAQAGLTVVSGLALGVDGAAHAGALDACAPNSVRPATVAVVGTGLDRVYPKRHQALARRIASDGLLISEYPIGTHPIAANFPRRNRIISGLSQGTLVVEAALQSGSLITARLAAEQGKEVFAIPGSIHAAQSRGCHALIRQGAKLVESAQDVLEELPGPPSDGMARPAERAETRSAAAPPGTDPALLQALGHDPVALDTLQDRTGLDTAQLQAQLMALELAGLVGRMPGGRFQRIAGA